GLLAKMLAVIAFAGAPAADGDSARIALLPVELVDAPAGAAESIQAQLRGGLERAHFVVVDGGAALGEHAGESCDRECMRAIATSTQSARIVAAKLTVADTVWSVSIDLVDGRTGEAEASVADTCEICGLDEVGELVAARVAGLAERTRAIAAVPPILSVRTEPASAAVFIDGTAIGTAPLRQELVPGRHVVRVEHEGYAPRERVVLSEAGVHESIAIELAPEAELASVRRKRQLALGLGGASIAVGVLSVATGIPLLAIDGRDDRRRCNADAQGDCEMRFETRVGGAIATAVGIALVATGATVIGIVQARRRTRSSRASLHPGGFVWRF
ncbi:MAG TPA: PEGA domain-containing protein, partial [Nannocystaceae bacterium]|nr:PEGA domain-containing protein [Nannocystaceae bacterium]